VVGQQLQVADESSVIQRALQFPVTDADAPEELVRRKALQVPSRLLCAERQVADHAHDERLRRREVEHPLVILDPGAGLHDDCAGHRLGYRQGEVVFGEHRAVQQLVVTRRPWNPARPRGIVEVGVRVDDRKAVNATDGLTGRGMPIGCPSGPGCSGGGLRGSGQKPSTADAGTHGGLHDDGVNPRSSFRHSPSTLNGCRSRSNLSWRLYAMTSRGLFW